MINYAIIITIIIVDHGVMWLMVVVKLHVVELPSRGLHAQVFVHNIPENIKGRSRQKTTSPENTEEYRKQNCRNKVKRCLARYSPRATTTNQPTNRAPNKPARPVKANMNKNANFEPSLVIFWQKS